MQPTKEQIQWFWEQCGWEWFEVTQKWSQLASSHWSGPNNEYTLALPPIDLNNLFKYAVPVLLEKIGKYELLVLVNNAICNAVNAHLYGQEGIPDHLFWAIYKAFGGKE